MKIAFFFTVEFQTTSLIFEKLSNNQELLKQLQLNEMIFNSFGIWEGF